MKEEQPQDIEGIWSYYFGPEPPQMPKLLPQPVYEFCKGCPANLVPVLANSFFPMAAIYIRDIKYFYVINGLYYEPHFLELKLGEQSGGKSSLDIYVSVFHKDVLAQDDINLAAIEEYERKMDKGEKVEELANKLVQYASPNSTDAGFRKQLLYNQQEGNYHAFLLLSELDQANRLSDNDPYTLFRLAYDMDTLSSTRATVNSVRGRVKNLRLDVLGSTTFDACFNFFARHMLDGTFSRFSFSLVPSQACGERQQRFDWEKIQTLNERMKPFVDRLKSSHGEFNCKEINRFTNRMFDELYDIASLSQSQAFNVLLRRSGQTAFMKACLLYTAMGKWNKTIEDFVMWSVRNDMWIKMRYFSEAFEQASQKLKVRTKGPKNLLTLLPDQFTEEEAIRTLSAQGKTKKNVENMLKQWKKRFHIREERDSSDSKLYIKINSNVMTGK